MSDLLSIGASGVRTYQTALTTVSENIANAGNPAFARRSPTLGEVVAVVGLYSGTAPTGMSVTMAGVSRMVDLRRNADVRAARSDLARTQTGAVWLEGIGSALADNQLGARMTAFFTSAQGLAGDPTSSAQRTVMLESATSLAAAFTASGKAMAGALDDLDATAAQATGTLTALGRALAEVNDGIAKTRPDTAAAAGLADQRDAILEQMSALVDVDVCLDDLGRASVRLGGAGGPLFVSGKEAGTVSATRSADGQVSFAVGFGGTVSPLVPNGGALAGVADGVARLADAREALDALATDFAARVNAVQAQGRDANGHGGAPLFAVGASPTDLTVALTDGAGIAAASAGEGERGNGNLQALASLRQSAGFETRLTSAVAANAAAIKSRGIVADAQGSIRDRAVAVQAAVSGVNLDSEAVDLLRFQQAYQASGRVIQVARETFQSVLAIN